MSPTPPAKVVTVIEKKLNNPTTLVKIIVSRNSLNFLVCSSIVVSSVMHAANSIVRATNLPNTYNHILIGEV
jgi:hypothetical protein